MEALEVETEEPLDENRIKILSGIKVDWSTGSEKLARARILESFVELNDVTLGGTVSACTGDSVINVLLYA